MYINIKFFRLFGKFVWERRIGPHAMIDSDGPQQLLYLDSSFLLDPSP